MARTVNYKILKPDGTPFTGAKLTFALSPDTYNTTETFPSGTVVSNKTSSDGTGSVELFQNATGAESTKYEVTLPSGERFDIVVPPGSVAIELSSMRGGVVPSIISGGFFLLSTYANLSDAVTSIGATVGTLLMDIASTLTANVSVPSTLSVIWLSQGNLLTTSTFTVTFNSALSAPSFEIFDTSGGGAVVLGAAIVDDATPSILGRRNIRMEYTGATNVTDFDDPTEGQGLVVLFKDGNVTLVHSSTFRLLAASNYNPAANAIMEFKYLDAKWHEVSRTMP